MQLNFKKWLVAEDSVGPLFSRAGEALARDTAEKLVPIINRQVSGPVAQAAEKGANQGTTAALMKNSPANKTPAALRTPGDVSGITKAQQQAAFNPQAQQAPDQGGMPLNIKNLGSAIADAVKNGFKQAIG